MNDRSERISPTAYATGYLWYRHGLSHPGLLLPEGRRVARAFQAVSRTTQLLGGGSLDALMLARHQGIDARLTHAIEQLGVTQVIELAAGLSPRGWRFKRRYGAPLAYVETDLPAMVATKRALLEKSGLAAPGHRVEIVDALAPDGPTSLAAIARSLDAAQGTAIITEGLMNYLAPEAARGVWRRIGAALRGFPVGVYLSDAYVNTHTPGPALKLFYYLLQAFVRGRMHQHFEREDDARTAMREAGFASMQLHAARDLPETRALAAHKGVDRVRILEAHAKT